MKTLTLLRHAKSGWDDPALRDFDRALNAKGQRAALAVGRHLRMLGMSFDHVVASPAVRVTETIDQLMRGYGDGLSPVWDRRAYLASDATLLDIVHELPESASSAMIVGHNPGLEDLVLKLVPDAADNGLRDSVEEKFPTASVAVMSCTGSRWIDVGSGCATLIRFIRPRDLDPALGPNGD